MNDHPQSIILKSRNDRISGLMSALGRSAGETIEIKSAAISLCGASPEEREIDIAMASATKPRGSRFGRFLKRHFLRAQFVWAFNFFSRQPLSTVLCWNGTKGYRFLLMQAARRAGHDTIYLEECPLPERISVDRAGINFGNSLPRDARFFLEWARRNPEALGRWRAIRDQIKQRRPIKQNLVDPSDQPRQDLSQSKYIFCPLQVPSDSQLTVYGGQCTTVEKTVDILHRYSKTLPDNVHIRLKEHPSAKVRLTSMIRDLGSERFVLDNEYDTVELIKGSIGVVTVNSSVGLEALFFDKPVATLGHAFYGFEGITTQVTNEADFAAWVQSLEKATLDMDAKNALLDYLVGVHFPLESAILSGEFSLDELEKRDNTANSITTELQAGQRKE